MILPAACPERSAANAGQSLDSALDREHVERPGGWIIHLCVGNPRDHARFPKRGGRCMTRQTPSGRYWKIARVVLGWTLIVLGIIGLFLPFLQGIVLIVSGLALLSKDRPWARRWLYTVKGWVRRERKQGE